MESCQLFGDLNAAFNAVDIVCDPRQILESNQGCSTYISDDFLMEEDPKAWLNEHEIQKEDFSKKSWERKREILGASNPVQQSGVGEAQIEEFERFFSLYNEGLKPLEPLEKNIEKDYIMDFDVTLLGQGLNETLPSANGQDSGAGGDVKFSNVEAEPNIKDVRHIFECQDPAVCPCNYKAPISCVSKPGAGQETQYLNEDGLTSVVDIQESDGNTTNFLPVENAILVHNAYNFAEGLNQEQMTPINISVAGIAYKIEHLTETASKNGLGPQLQKMTEDFNQKFNVVPESQTAKSAETSTWLQPSTSCQPLKTKRGRKKGDNTKRIANAEDPNVDPVQRKKNKNTLSSFNCREGKGKKNAAIFKNYTRELERNRHLTALYEMNEHKMRLLSQMTIFRR